MKISKKVLLLAAISLSPAVQGFTLYDAAPSLDLPEAHALRYNFNVSVGYDTNVDDARDNERGSGKATASFGGSYSKVESVLTASYSFTLGATYYIEGAEGTEDHLFSNSSFNAKVDYQLDSRSNVSLAADFRYTPDIDYGNTISSPTSQGDVLYWDVTATGTHTISPLTSFSITMETSGVEYAESQHNIDDRNYVGINSSLTYAYTPLTNLSFNISGRYDFRDYGIDSENLYMTLGLSSRLSPVASISINAGVQSKFISDQINYSPNIRISYNHQMYNDDSMSFYVNFDNENVGTARYDKTSSDIVSYFSNAAVRVGLTYNKKFSADWSGNASVEYYSASYSDGEVSGMEDENRVNIFVSAGLSYKLTESVSLNLNYTFTDANEDAGGYQRHSITAGTGYSF